MSKYTMVDGSQSFARTQSGAIININSTEINRIKNLRVNQRETKAAEREEINQLKSDVKDIKMMLSQIIEKL